MDEKLQSKNMQKREHFSVLQNAPFRSQIFKIFFASGGKGALTPLTKILLTFLTMWWYCAWLLLGRESELGG